MSDKDDRKLLMLRSWNQDNHALKVCLLTSAFSFIVFLFLFRLVWKLFFGCFFWGCNEKFEFIHECLDQTSWAATVNIKLWLLPNTHPCVLSNVVGLLIHYTTMMFWEVAFVFSLETNNTTFFCPCLFVRPGCISQKPTVSTIVCCVHNCLFCFVYFQFDV